MKTVSVIWVKGLLQAASMQGVSEHAVLSSAGLAPDSLSVAGDRISLSDTLLLWRAAERLSADPLFGFNMGKSLQPSQFQLIAFTMLSSKTLGSAIDKILKYQRLISDGGAFSLTKQHAVIDHSKAAKEVSSLIYRPTENDFSYHQIDAVIAAVVSFIRWLLGRDRLILEVHLQHDKQQGLSLYQDYYQAPVLFEQADNSLLFDSKLLAERLPGYDPNLAAMHEQMADSQLKRLLEPSIIAQVQAQLMASDADVSRDKIAQKMAMSGRSLQRKLQQEESSFQQLFDEFRHQRSLLFLQDKHLSLTDIAQKLGFAENSTFYRAFKRWQGITPGEYRHVLLESKTQP
ncbi:MAG: AraC family transcriptional regulator [Oleispira sp.]|nr:AraC family transcriptional regulator [Oleispira sp.]MBL4881945.1 AraC family transcriptional regulator [Oleispira sp.]